MAGIKERPLGAYTFDCISDKALPNQRIRKSQLESRWNFADAVDLAIAHPGCVVTIFKLALERLHDSRVATFTDILFQTNAFKALQEHHPRVVAEMTIPSDSRIIRACCHG